MFKVAREPDRQDRALPRLGERHADAGHAHACGRRRTGRLQLDQGPGDGHGHGPAAEQGLGRVRFRRDREAGLLLRLAAPDARAELVALRRAPPETARAYRSRHGWTTDARLLPVPAGSAARIGTGECADGRAAPPATMFAAGQRGQRFRPGGPRLAQLVAARSEPDRCRSGSSWTSAAPVAFNTVHVSFQSRGTSGRRFPPRSAPRRRLANRGRGERQRPAAPRDAVRADPLRTAPPGDRREANREMGVCEIRVYNSGGVPLCPRVLRGEIEY